MNTENYAYVKGQIVPSSQAVISIEERGFRLGDGIFETIRVVKGKPYLWPAHFDRLQLGMRIFQISPSKEVENLPTIIQALLSKNQISEGMIRISLSRGIGSTGYLPHPDADPTCVVQVTHGFPKANQGIKLWNTNDYHGYGLPVKSMQCLPYILARMEAVKQGCFEALLTHSKGWVAETSSANIFWVKDKTIYTPHLQTGIIGGVIRKRLIELSPYQVKEGKYLLSQLQEAEEVFISNVSCLITPVQAIEGEGMSWKFNTAGTITKELQRLLESDATS